MAEVSKLALALTAAFVGFACVPPEPTSPDTTTLSADLFTATGLRPGVRPRSFATAAPAGPACNLSYYGGPVLQNVKIYEVNWTAAINPLLTANLGHFYADFATSAAFDWLSEYNTVGKNGQDGLPGSNQGIGRGSFGGSFTLTPSKCASSGACQLSDTDLQNEIIAQVTAGHLPAPSVGCDGLPNEIYMFDFPSNVTIVDSTGAASCVQFCAYHSTATLTINGAAKTVAYGVHPDVMTGACATGCGADTPLNNATSAHSHELIEAITDTGIGIATTLGRPIAWYNASRNCGEIGDICNNVNGTIPCHTSCPAGATTWTVQAEWSNQAGACIVTKPSLPAACTGVNQPAGCRPCSCADDGVACAGGTPHCEVDPANIKANQCVMCTANAQCSSGQCTKSTSTSTDDLCAAVAVDAGVPDSGADAGVLDAAGVIDAGFRDAAALDATAPDAAPRDATAPDAAPRDAAALDASPRDAAAPDAAASDAAAPDAASAPDAAARDAAAPDATAPDAGARDAAAVDAAARDAASPDAASPPDAGARDAAAPDAAIGPDATVARDAATPVDASSAPDAAVGRDAAAPDATAPHDAGLTTDGGARADGAVADAGSPSDAGARDAAAPSDAAGSDANRSDARADASPGDLGASVDASATLDGSASLDVGVGGIPLAADGGCGCQSTHPARSEPQLGGLGLLVLLGLTRRRRPRPSLRSD